MVADDIGSRGEAIFAVLVSDFCSRRRPYFRPRYLGEKAETIDFLLEVLDVEGATPFCFVQVKTTRLGYTKRSPRRLKVGLSDEEVARLVRFPAPTYFVGIDEVAQVGFLMAVLSGTVGPIPSLPTRFPVTCDNLRAWSEEVTRHWQGRETARTDSVFSE